MIRKLYRQKGTIDEIIFRTTKIRNRLLLELMARGGMRFGEVLKLRLKDLQAQKLVLEALKSGKEQEIVFIPQKVAERDCQQGHSSTFEPFDPKVPGNNKRC